MGQIVGLVFSETEPEQEKPKKRRGKADAELC